MRTTLILQSTLPLLQAQLSWPPMVALLVAGHAYQSLCRCKPTADALWSLILHQSPSSPQETKPEPSGLQVENYPSSYATVKVVQTDPLAWKGDLLVVGIYSCCIKAEGELFSLTGTGNTLSICCLPCLRYLQHLFSASAGQKLTCFPAGFVAKCPLQLSTASL